jgi:two-component system response regulator (stage 0 sporulation protein F)
LQTILAIDDQPGIRRLLEEIFKGTDYKIIPVAGGRDALKYLQQQKPELVLLDVKMPGLDGIEVLRELTALYPGLPVIMMTAYGELQVIDEAIDLGARGYITKPFDIMELRRLVESILNP